MQTDKIIFTLLAAHTISWATAGWESKIPNGEYAQLAQKSRCQICHEYSAPDAGTANFFNGFGANFKAAGNHWGQSLATQDSDGDGWSNEVELNCQNNFTWTFGPCGSDLGRVFNPGDPEVTPNIAAEGSALAQSNTAKLKALPNPFNRSTSIVYAFSASTAAALRIFDARGKKVLDLAAARPRASGRFQWHGADAAGHPLPAGVYVVTLSAGRAFLREKVVLTR